MLFGTKFIYEFIYFTVKNNNSFCIMRSNDKRLVFLIRILITRYMMVTQDRQFPLSTPLSTFLTLIFIWSRWVVGNGDVDDGVLSSFLTLTSYGAEQYKMWSWLSEHLKPFFSDHRAYFNFLLQNIVVFD